MNDFDIPLFKKSYDFYKELYLYLKRFPKSDRYTLAEKISGHMLFVIENIVCATTVSKLERVPLLEKASQHLHLLKVFIRLGKDICIIDTKTYISFNECIDEIGRMIGGWQRFIKK